MTESRCQPALPDDDRLQISVSSEGLGLSAEIIGSPTVAIVRARIADIQAAKAAGHCSATMPGKVLAMLRATDIRAASMARATNPTAWSNALEDILLYHVARFVFDGIEIPYTMGPATSARPMFVDEPVPGGVTFHQNGVETHLAPPAGATLAAVKTAEGTDIVLVSADGRREVVAAIRTAP